VVAIAALVAALAGTAVASDPVANSSALSKKKVKKIANKQIDKAAPDLTVGNSEQLGGQPPEAYEEPVAYAHIRKSGAVVASESKNFATANVTKRPAASYCLSGLPDFNSVSVTPDYINDVDEQTDKSAQVGIPGTGFVGGCGGVGGLQAEIATVVDSTYVHHGIYVQLFD
jgi:hypothetical protein